VEILAGVAAGHDRELGLLELEGLDATGLDERGQAEGLDAGSEVDHVLGIADGPEDAAGTVDLDDVTTVDALLDAVADLADEDGWRRAPRPDSISGCASGHDRRNLPAIDDACAP
jgi:hypothetical protein